MGGGGEVPKEQHPTESQPYMQMRIPPRNTSLPPHEQTGIHHADKVKYRHTYNKVTGCILAIPAPGKVRQEDQEFRAIPDHIVSSRSPKRHEIQALFFFRLFTAIYRFYYVTDGIELGTSGRAIGALSL